MVDAKFHKVAAALAFAIGIISILAGGKVLQGWNPGYTVLSWLPVYNLAMGVWSALVPAPLLWKRSRWGMPAAIGTLAVHSGMLAALVAAFRGSAATESLFAMLFRVAVWLGIVALVWAGRREIKTGVRV